MATSYNFTTEEAKRLWNRASPKGNSHKAAFAWRESPAGVDRTVSRIIRPMTKDQAKEWIDDCMLSADIQSRYRGEQIKAGDSIGRPKGLAVWLADGDWGAEIGSTGELKQKQNAKTCKCGKPVQHISGNCWECYEKAYKNPMSQELRQACQEGGYHKMTKEQNMKECRRLIGRII